LIVAVYAAVMVATNTRFTILDDEADSIAIAGRPVGAAVRPFFTGAGFHELHPPLTEILVHVWLVATHYSFFLLRVFANIFYAGAVLITAKSAEKLAGKRAYWATLALGFAWPFSFQYGRVTGWYCLCMFLVAWLTWAYLKILDDHGYRAWIAFAAASVLLVWSNYFGFAVLFLLLFDFILFHRDVARKQVWPLLVVVASIAIAFWPLRHVGIGDVALYATPAEAGIDWKNALAVAGYPCFAIFGSAAIAPWYWVLSIPVFLSILVLLVSIWRSGGRRWLASFALALALLDLSGMMNIKRVLFLLPWLFLAMALAIFQGASRHSRLAVWAIAVIVVCGWVGIASGKHYATTNLYEPWGDVAKSVAQDARSGATIISVNAPFFFYLNYELGLESDTEEANGTLLAPGIYREHGYTVLHPVDPTRISDGLRGKVVMVNGPGLQYEVEEQTALNDALHQRCRTLGEYYAAPDPAAVWKRRFVKDAAVLDYRVEVIWYDCGR
jgi:hypothetical protein